MQTAAGSVELASAFAQMPSLSNLDFYVVQQGTALLWTPDEELVDESARVEVGLKWGLKSDLNWEDCVQEARLIVNACSPHAQPVDWARRLLTYIKEKAHEITQMSPNGVTPERYKKLLSSMAFHPARTPCSVFSGAGVPEGPVQLFAAQKLHDAADAQYIWAVEPSAYLIKVPFLLYCKLTPNVVAKQIIELAKLGQDADGAQLKGLEHHLLAAATKLARDINEDDELTRIGKMLQEVLLASLNTHLCKRSASRLCLPSALTHRGDSYPAGCVGPCDQWAKHPAPRARTSSIRSALRVMAALWAAARFMGGSLLASEPFGGCRSRQTNRLPDTRTGAPHTSRRDDARH